MTDLGPSRRWPRRLVNGLTLSRLALAGAFPALPEAWWGPAAVAGGLTDLVDGWISRRLGATSTFGQVADPIADKALVASVLLTLWHDGRFPAWHLPLVGARDLAVAGGSAWMLLRRGWRAIGQLPPSLLGKAATAGQFVFILTVLYHHESAVHALVPAAALSLAAGAGYLWRPGGGRASPAPCDCSATTSTRGSAAETGATGSSASSR